MGTLHHYAPNSRHIFFQKQQNSEKDNILWKQVEKLRLIYKKIKVAQKRIKTHNNKSDI